MEPVTSEKPHQVLQQSLSLQRHNKLIQQLLMSIAPILKKERKFLAQLNVLNFMFVAMGQHIYSNVQRWLQVEGCTLIQHWMFVIGHKMWIAKSISNPAYNRKKSKIFLHPHDK